jgi:hypothetical protein
MLCPASRDTSKDIIKFSGYQPCQIVKRKKKPRLISVFVLRVNILLHSIGVKATHHTEVNIDVGKGGSEFVARRSKGILFIN